MAQVSPVVIKIRASDSDEIEAALVRIKVVFPGAFIGRVQQANDGVFVFINANVELRT